MKPFSAAPGQPLKAAQAIREGAGMVSARLAARTCNGRATGSQPKPPTEDKMQFCRQGRGTD